MIKIANFNKVIIVGNITRDLELKYVASGTAVLQFSLATNRTWFDKASNSKKEEVTYVDVTAWGNSADTIAQYCGKGSPLMVEGRLKQETWQDKATGANRSKLIVVLESFQFLGGGGKSGGDSEGGGGRQGGSRGGGRQNDRGTSSYGGGQPPRSAGVGSDSDGGGGYGGSSDIPEDEVPF